ncbi:XRE family transcriptional regulator [Streptomyces niveiscabiei]|uniref:RICIN domain-containing protein n=1 Tax=Streptomyces niveiscabiei TaxID=164115 RepID=UPI0029B1BE9E|nr:XRE family transcriptional regulator [Streptomyces niveiscabiei]MDX3381854.1 XRE family transcriptional regulator [Streptomyces niveiscabiei]
MRDMGDVSPYEARDPAEFVAVMRLLKERSGLTYRELEVKAARNGDVLARSTLADVLGRANLPRPDVVAAFIRACGDGERVGVWLEARERIASGAVAPVDAEPDEGAEELSLGPAPRRFTVRGGILVAVCVLPLLGLGLWWLLGDDNDDGDGGFGDARAAALSGWVTIRPARTPELCLTDGRDRAGAYPSAVAVQLPCAQATVPRTYLEPAGENLYRVQWHHPQEGRGCLAVMDSGPVKGMLEPRNDCSQGTLLRLEAVGDAFRFRVVSSGRCIGVADAKEGAEASERRCGDSADQRFLVRRD